MSKMNVQRDVRLDGFDEGRKYIYKFKNSLFAHLYWWYCMFNYYTRT